MAPILSGCAWVGAVLTNKVASSQQDTYALGMSCCGSGYSAVHLKMTVETPAEAKGGPFVHCAAAAGLVWQVAARGYPVLVLFLTGARVGQSHLRERPGGVSVKKARTAGGCGIENTPLPVPPDARSIMA